MNHVHMALYNLLKEYTARQELVKKAMLDLRPDILARFDEKITDEEVIRLAIQYSQSPQQGKWGTKGEWDYYFHGTGCRLINRATQEIIEWDAPDTQCFDRGWFWNYLAWKLNNQTTSNDNVLFDYLNSTGYPPKDEVFKLLDELQQHARVEIPNITYRDKYTLR